MLLTTHPFSLRRVCCNRHSSINTGGVRILDRRAWGRGQGDRAPSNPLKKKKRERAAFRLPVRASTKENRLELPMLELKTKRFADGVQRSHLLYLPFPTYYLTFTGCVYLLLTIHFLGSTSLLVMFFQFDCRLSSLATNYLLLTIYPLLLLLTTKYLISFNFAT